MADLDKTERSREVRTRLSVFVRRTGLVSRTTRAAAPGRNVRKLLDALQRGNSSPSRGDFPPRRFMILSKALKSA